MQVAEINDSNNLSRQRQGRPNQDVVIVSVAVNDTAPQVRQRRHNFRVIERQGLFNQSASRSIANQMKMRPNPACPSQIPFELAPGCPLRKTLKRPVHFTKQPTKS